ncbi:uncharacterized protein LOC128554805 [Mercenaria mercenaria]|uniref:uncharacterized protein LOC128554805 n=1 Tax=Mercenaria mercenaria TaxID=6596 RepID=UPI00234F1214|nr:uncharacterized protein LOC128554805 [Mercenaria mercenaria]
MDAEKKYQEGKKTNAESLKTINQQETKLRTLEKEERRLKEELVKRSEQRANVNTFTERYHNLEQQLKNTQRELKNTKDELEHTKTRLSESMGAKLTDNNPNIADLSDKNRPTKLSERFQEIYDNEWTDAFEVFVSDRSDDEKAVSVLLSILMDTKEFCDQEAKNQMKQIQCALMHEANSERNTGSAIPAIPANINKLLKDSRKYMAEVSGKQLCKKYQENLRFSPSSTARKAKSVPKYLEACFSVCWMMAVQDPPVVFGPNIQRGDAFNTDIYKAYTKNGKTVAYVVWPALLLHANGPVLCKGVAQGLGEPTRRTKSAPPYERRAQFRNDGSNWKEYSNDTHIIDSEQNDHYALNDQEYNQDLKYGTDGFDIYGTNARDRNIWDNKSSIGGTESAMREHVSRKLLDDLDDRVYDQSTRDYRSGRSGYESNPRTHYSGTNYKQSSALAYDSGLTNYTFQRTRYISDAVYNKPNNYPHSSSSYKQMTVTRQPHLEHKHTSRREQGKPAWR